MSERTITRIMRMTIVVGFGFGLGFAGVSGFAYAEEVTAIGTLKKGTILSEQNLTIKPDMDESYDDIKSRYVGLELKRTIYAGKKVNMAYVGAPIIVKRNTPVTMTYTYGAMRLSAKGRALGSGSIGDEIQLINTSSRKKVTGTITGHDLVEVGQ